MKESKALIIILVSWSLVRSWRDFSDALDQIRYNGNVNDIHALTVFFGTAVPGKNTMDDFQIKYQDWVWEIEDKTKEILLGNITVEQVILDRIVKETWL